MAVTFTLNQVRSVEPSGYRVASTIKASPAPVGIERQLFLFRKAGAVYQHVCTVDDMETYPAATALPYTGTAEYYRWYEVVADYSLVAAAQDHASNVKVRLAELAVDYDAAVNAFVGSEDTPISS